MLLLSSRVIATVVYLLNCVLTHGVVRAARPSKAKKFAIDFNRTFYTSRFEVCKKSRVFDPVEEFKAQAYAATAYSKCGPKTIIKLGSKFNFPAYGIVKLIDILCWALNVSYAFLANDGTLMIQATCPNSAFLKIINMMIGYLIKTGFKAQLKHRGSSFILTADMLQDFLNHVLPCVFDKATISQPDGDYLKHLLNHAKVMLL